MEGAFKGAPTQLKDIPKVRRKLEELAPPERPGSADKP